jgi:hypothetical protein
VLTPVVGASAAVGASAVVSSRPPGAAEPVVTGAAGQGNWS